MSGDEGRSELAPTRFALLKLGPRHSGIASQIDPGKTNEIGRTEFREEKKDRESHSFNQVGQRLAHGLIVSTTQTRNVMVRKFTCQSFGMENKRRSRPSFGAAHRRP